MYKDMKYLLLYSTLLRCFKKEMQNLMLENIGDYCCDNTKLLLHCLFTPLEREMMMMMIIRCVQCVESAQQQWQGKRGTRQETISAVM